MIKIGNWNDLEFTYSKMGSNMVLSFEKDNLLLYKSLPKLRLVYYLEVYGLTISKNSSYDDFDMNINYTNFISIMEQNFKYYYIKTHNGKDSHKFKDFIKYIVKLFNEF